MANPIDKVIARKKAIDKADKEKKRRKNISKRTKGKQRKRKAKSKFKKRRKKKVTTTQVAQPPIRLTNKGGDKLEVNIVAKERRKKRKKAPKTYAERRAEEIAKTGVADPAILKQQQRVASEVLGYTTQTRDPLALRAGRGRYNVAGGVAGFGDVGMRYDTKREDQGIRTPQRVVEIKRDDAQKELEEQAKARRGRQASFRTRGTQTRRGYDDDDDDDDGRGGSPLRARTQTKRTPQPQPEPQPEPQPQTAPSRRETATSPILTQTARRTTTATSPINTTQTADTATSPVYIPPPLPRRTPPESYFAGVPPPDAPIRFRPLSQPVPPQSPAESVDEEIVELTGGQPLTPVNIGFQAIPEEQQRTPAEDYFSGSQLPLGFQEDAPTGIDPSGREEFFTPTLTGSEVLPPEEQPPTASRLDKPSARRRTTRQPDRPQSQLATAELEISGDTAFRRPAEPKGVKFQEPEPEPEPEAVPPPPIQSVRRGRGRPKGSKNKPRADTPKPDTPTITAKAQQEIQQSGTRFEAVRIQNILKRRLGSFGAKEVDAVQSLEELNEAIRAFTNDEETAQLIRQYWRLRKQQGF